MCHVLKIAEINVVTGSFFGQQRVQRVVKIIVPLRVEPVSAKLCGPDQPGIVERAFSDDIDAAIERSALFMDGFRQFFQKIQRGVIEDGMNGVEP